MQIAYVKQLKMKPEDLEDTAVLSINNQATNSHIRAYQAKQTEDTNNFNRMKVWQLSFGLFHLCLNLIWALLLVHCGTILQTGSLKLFFAVLEKTQLSKKYPDYHTLLAVLTQILHGIIMAHIL